MEDINNDFNPFLKLPKDLTIFDTASLMEVEALAAGLNKEETLDYFAVSQEQLDSSPPDAKIFEAAYKRGRSKAKFQACKQLFVQMGGRNGSLPALAYLRQVAQEWPNANPEEGSNKKFAFKVVLDGADEE